MLKLFKRKNRNLTKREAELKEYEKQIEQMLKECLETIDEAKEYLELCGFSEKDLEQIRMRSKIKVIRGGKDAK